MNSAKPREVFSAEWPGGRLGILGLLLSGLYFFGVLLRRLAYASGFMPVRRLPAPVISVGNLTVGGTGKTVCVEYLARLLLDWGVHPAVVSRGYGAYGKPDGGLVQDEAMVLSENVPGLPVVMDGNRARGGWEAIRRHGADVILLDDAFSHLGIGRDLDIVLIDSSSAWESEDLLPLGRLREPRWWLRRAQVIILTRVDQAPSENIAHLRREVRRIAPEALQLEAVHEPWRVTSLLEDEEHEPAWLQGKRVYLLSAIASASAFEKTVCSLGAQVTGHAVFRDHHQFTAEDVAQTIQKAGSSGAQFVLCTQKDAVKLVDLLYVHTPFYALVVRMRMLSGAEAFEKYLGRLVKAKTA